MIIDYDHNPNASVDQKLQSLKESVQLALNEIVTALNNTVTKEELISILTEQNENS